MFGTKSDTTEPAAAYGGVTYESRVLSFTGIDNDKTVEKTLGDLGAQGWEPVAVIDRPLAHTKRGIGEGFTVILKRRILAG